MDRIVSVGQNLGVAHKLDPCRPAIPRKPNSQPRRRSACHARKGYTLNDDFLDEVPSEEVDARRRLESLVEVVVRYVGPVARIPVDPLRPKLGGVCHDSVRVRSEMSDGKRRRSQTS